MMSILSFTMYDIVKLSKTRITVQYDCRLSEISPDYPQSVKQKCRELMLKK